MILSSPIIKLNVKEMMSLIRYLGKWLKKFERFPQAGPCPESSNMLGLEACDWVSRLEVVVKCLVVMLDENFSPLVLHPECHGELRSIEGVVGTLAFKSRLCCSMAAAINNLGVDDEFVQNKELPLMFKNHAAIDPEALGGGTGGTCDWSLTT